MDETESTFTIAEKLFLSYFPWEFIIGVIFYWQPIPLLSYPLCNCINFSELCPRPASSKVLSDWRNIIILALIEGTSKSWLVLVGFDFLQRYSDEAG